MTAAAIIIGTLVMTACLFLLALGKASAEADRDATRIHDEYQMRYRGGTDLCRVCHEPVFPCYSDEKGPVHPECREDVR